ncbi:MAG: hypothetical protein IK076_06980, partial [Bacteroidales bacterium]|nr:hypothetical protein [Bacteroidales bacterium]
DGKYYCPGIGDDTASLSQVFGIMRAIKGSGLKFKGDLIIGGNVGEEGLGDLYGMKNFFKNNADKVDGFLSIDGSGEGVCEAGTGMNNIDAGLCAERGVVVRNVAGYSTDAVTQHTWMLILALAGRIFHYDSYVKDGRYFKAGLHTDPGHPFTELTGKTIGIVGMGAIGSKVAKVAGVFGLRVIYYSTSGTSHCTEYPSVPLETLMAEADVISIHAPYNERTAGLIGYDELCLMKPTAFLVNTSRGGIAREAALARAIDEGRIAGIALDVYEREPLPPESPLLHTSHPERVILSPHVAWTSEETRQRLADEMAGNIRKGWPEDS